MTPDAPANNPAPHRKMELRRVMFWVLLAAAVAHTIAYLFITSQRIVYPFELEWMEGALVDHTARILAGLDLYTEPSTDHVSYLYTPLYYYLAALASSITEIGYLPLRMIASISSLGCALLIGLAVRQEAQGSGEWRNRIAVIAGSVFLAGFWIVDGWHDLARNDGLFLLLTLVTIALLRNSTDRRVVAAGIVVTLAFLAKQTALMLLPALAIGLAFLSVRRAIVFTISTSISLAVTIGLYCLLTDGWFFYFVFQVPSAHPGAAGIDFFGSDMQRLWPSLAIAGLFFLTGLESANRRTTLFYSSVAAGLLFASYMSRHHAGGYINALMPWLVGAGLLLGITLQRLASSKTVVPIAVLALAITQFGLMVKDPRGFLPSADHRAAHEQLQDYLYNIPGSIFLPFQGHTAAAVNKPTSMHAMAMHDLQLSQTSGYPVLLKSLGVAQSEKRFDLIVLNDPHTEIFLGQADTLPGYQPVTDLPFDLEHLRPLHGMPTKPSLFLMRIE